MFRRAHSLNLTLVFLVAVTLLSACGGPPTVEQPGPSPTATASSAAAPTTTTTSSSAAQMLLTVSKSNGVDGSPSTSAEYSSNGVVNYSYAPQPGYSTLQVSLDGSPAAASGTITMNAAHQLQVSAVALQTNATPKLQVAIFMHSEDPHHAETPDFVADAQGFLTFRSALIDFAGRMRNANLRWNFQPDWNFLNGILEYEVTHPDASLLSATGGKNILRYLHDDLGVEIDPHSHENDGYNYADVAYLIAQLGVTPAPVVGGHIYDPSDANYQDWPRFVTGLTCRKFTCPAWHADLLMGMGTTNHRNDPVVTGIWQPASPNDYFTPGSSGIATFGGWDNEMASITALADQVLSGARETTLLWTFSVAVNHSDIVKAGFLTGTMQPIIDQLVQLQGASRIEVDNFTSILSRWRNDYSQRPSVFRQTTTIASKYVSFSLNTQDFSYVTESAALMNRVLDLHEQLNVPLDVFLTTTQVDAYETEQPALLRRILTSPQVTMSYHVRAPMPYANGYDWRGLAGMSYSDQAALIHDYETHGLDLVTGQPTTASGGFQKLTILWGKAPRICGGAWDAPVAQAAADTFASLGCQMIIDHSRAVNAGETRLGLLLKPEHVDHKVFEHVGEDGAAALDAAIAESQTVAGTRAAFVGVKMHDNDFFATQSAWTYVYQDGGRRRPNWDITRKAPLLSAAEQSAMWTLYEQTIRRAAALRDAGTIQLVNADNLIALAQASQAPVSH